jgi:hypothetical protein
MEAGALVVSGEAGDARTRRQRAASVAMAVEGRCNSPCVISSEMVAGI